VASSALDAAPRRISMATAKKANKLAAMAERVKARGH
jgi:hypothetical protein